MKRSHAHGSVGIAKGGEHNPPCLASGGEHIFLRGVDLNTRVVRLRKRKDLLGR